MGKDDLESVKCEVWLKATINIVRELRAKSELSHKVVSKVWHKVQSKVDNEARRKVLHKVWMGLS